MDTLEICIFRLIACFHQCIEACLHQSGYAAAENRLLTKEVCFRLFFKCGFQDSASGSADACCISLRNFHGISAGILINGHQTGNALAAHILGTNRMSRSFRCNHDDIDVGRRNDLLKVNIKAVSKAQCFALGKMILNVLLVESRLLLIVDKDHDNIGSLHGISRIHNGKSVFLRLNGGFGAFVKADHNIHTGVS